MTPTTARSPRAPEPFRSLRSPKVPMISATRMRGARVGRDVADADPGLVQVVRESPARLRPLRADPHQDVGGQDAEGEHLEAEARQPRRVVRRAPADDDRDGDPEQGAHEEHRAEDVQEQREVDPVGRIATKISCSRLPDHQHEDDEHGDAVDRLEPGPGGAAPPARSNVLPAFRPPSRRRPEDERGVSTRPRPGRPPSIASPTPKRIVPTIPTPTRIPAMRPKVLLDRGSSIGAPPRVPRISPQCAVSAPTARNPLRTCRKSSQS